DRVRVCLVRGGTDDRRVRRFGQELTEARSGRVSAAWVGGVSEEIDPPSPVGLRLMPEFHGLGIGEPDHRRRVEPFADWESPSEILMVTRAGDRCGWVDGGEPGGESRALAVESLSFVRAHPGRGGIGGILLRSEE